MSLRLPGAAFARFLLVGGAGFVIDAGLTLLLMRAGMAPGLARVPAIAAAMGFTWLANRHFTYRVSTRRTASEALRYFAVALTMAALNYLVFRMLLIGGLPAFPAIVAATALQTAVSFVAYRRLAFRSP